MIGGRMATNRAAAEARRRATVKVGRTWCGVVCRCGVKDPRPVRRTRLVYTPGHAVTDAVAANA